MRDTSGDEYAARLESLSGARWKRILNVQLPYQWNLRRQRLGRRSTSAVASAATCRRWTRAVSVSITTPPPSRRRRPVA